MPSRFLGSEFRQIGAGAQQPGAAREQVGQSAFRFRASDMSCCRHRRRHFLTGLGTRGIFLEGNYRDDHRI
ncbi:unnamed protein product [Nezara viridula]|uniref:Uncharacterized protein n=1 Tax=Nezara viridula TaxID=85310 RepID=A0A9P0E544_NEZVI|nr:unnamed protein product [Nezara viridula]